MKLPIVFSQNGFEAEVHGAVSHSSMSSQVNWACEGWVSSKLDLVSKMKPFRYCTMQCKMQQKWCLTTGFMASKKIISAKEILKAFNISFVTLTLVWSHVVHTCSVTLAGWFYGAFVDINTNVALSSFLPGKTWSVLILISSNSHLAGKNTRMIQLY